MLELSEKMEYSSIEETLVEGKPKKILVVKGSGMDISHPGSKILETLVGVCEEEGIEMASLTGEGIREYLGIVYHLDSDKEEAIQELEKKLGIPKEELYSLLPKT